MLFILLNEQSSYLMGKDSRGQSLRYKVVSTLETRNEPITQSRITHLGDPLWAATPCASIRQSIRIPPMLFAVALSNCA